jgi:hypothetical protein
MDSKSDPVLLHPYAYFLFEQQSSAFIYWMVIENKIKIDRLKPIYLRIEIVDPARQSNVRLFDGSTYIVEVPVPSERLSSLPFKMVEGRMSKIFRLTGLTAEPDLHHFFNEPESNALFLELLLKALSECRKFFHVDAGEVQQNFQHFVENNYVVSWVKARRRFQEFHGVAVLYYTLDSYSMRKEIALIQKGVEVDRRLVTETGPHYLQWSGSFPIKVEGREVVMGNGTYRYEPFCEVRVVSLSPKNNLNESLPNSEL